LNYKEILSHLTGISTPILGIQWTPVTADVTTARNLIRELEDRRVLYRPEEMEGHQYCLISVEQIRRNLTDTIQKTGADTPLGKSSAKMRRACRKFCDIVGSPRFDALPFPVKKSILSRELTRLRKVFGLAIAEVSTAYGLDVEDELATIIPFNQD